MIRMCINRLYPRERIFVCYYLTETLLGMVFQFQKVNLKIFKRQTFWITFNIGLFLRVMLMGCYQIVVPVFNMLYFDTVCKKEIGQV